MKLPNPHLAIVEREKITEYLLNDAHPDNGGKALFFVALGFSQEESQTLANALLKLAQETEVAITVETSHGIKRLCLRSRNPTNGSWWIVQVLPISAASTMPWD